MVGQMDLEGFGGCTNFGECTAACPKEIGQWTIARMNADYLRSAVADRGERAAGGDAA
jgi:succinate dehydrogenase / fumarate reductase iron-sulfur subunit